MKKLVLLFVLSAVIVSCQSKEFTPNGKYEISVTNKEGFGHNILEIVGEEGDYFGYIEFNGKRKRNYPIGLNYKSSDSLSFYMSGGGYLRLKKENELWKGNFKYFGLQLEVQANRLGEACKSLQELVALKPLSIGNLSTEADETFPCYNASKNTLYFTRGGKIYQSEETGYLTFSEPKLVSFSADFNDSAPYLFNKGEAMLFTSNRPLPNSTKKKKNLWLTLKDSTENWIEPMSLDSPVNIDSLGEYHAAISSKANVFFVSYNRPGGFGRSDLYKATPVGDKYQVENLGEVINTKASEADAFIHPDEKYLLFASTDREDSFGADDIYVTFQKEGQWTLPKNLGAKVNSFAFDYGAWIDEKEEYFYFNSYRRGSSDLYRIPLTEIEILSKD